MNFSLIIFLLLVVGSVGISQAQLHLSLIAEKQMWSIGGIEALVVPCIRSQRYKTSTK